jgi:uncharacterized membrane protein
VRQLNLPDGHFSLFWIGIGWILFALAIIWSIRTAPWHKIKGDSEAQHVFIGTTVILFFLWISSASIGDGLSFHVLLVTAVTLMFGPQFALFSASLALVGVTLMGKSGVMMFGMNAVLMAVIPVSISWVMAVLAYRYLERHFFVFVLFNAFFAAAASTFAALLAAAAVMWLGGLHETEKLTQSFLPYIPMMVIPEAFANGLVILTLVILKPQWVSCFDDDEFLKGK